MNAEMELARQWLAKAENDLLNADNNLKSESIPYDTVCFHCQQAAEKLLKAYLVATGVQPPFTHDLLLLLEEILPYCADAETLRDDLALLMPYAVGVRYAPAPSAVVAGLPTVPGGVILYGPLFGFNKSTLNPGCSSAGASAKTCRYT